MGYLLRQLLTACLCLNAIRPLMIQAIGFPSMVWGWLTSELAPHLFALAALDTAAEPRRRRRSRKVRAPRLRLVLGLGNLAALGYLIGVGSRSGRAFETALGETLGSGYRDELSSRHADLDWKTPLRELAWPFGAGLRGVEVHRDLSYAPEHGRRGKLDVYVPQRPATGLRPVLVQVHGGAWTAGTKDQQGLPLMRHLAARGWVCVAPNYRLSPLHPFPAQLVDVKRAIAWIREHAQEYGADPGFVAITGGSAGGHLAALAALTPNDPEYQPGFEAADTSLQAAVPFYGVYDFAGATGSRAAVRMRNQFLGPWVLRANPRKSLEPFSKASPILRVRPDAPPFYVVHGVNDTMVPVDQARRFVQALRETSGAAVAYTELRAAQHAFDVFPSVRSQQSVRAVELFLRWVHDAWLTTRSAGT